MKNPRGGSRAAATSKMECFGIIVNGFQREKYWFVLVLFNILKVYRKKSFSVFFEKKHV